MTNNIDDYELCLRAENVFLPAEGYFGISAATGGLADDHDVTSFLTHSLTPPADDGSRRGPEVSDDERKKFEQEFDEYYQKLQKAKEEYVLYCTMYPVFNSVDLIIQCDMTRVNGI